MSDNGRVSNGQAILGFGVMGFLAMVLVGILWVASTNHVQPAEVVQQQIVLEDVIPSVIGGVVHVKAKTMGRQGSGFLVSSTVVVTARHVVRGETNFVVTLNDGTEMVSHRALYDKKYDIGFLMLDAPVKLGTPILKTGPITDCRLGQPVFAIGSPFGHLNFNSVTLGIISRMNCDLTEELEGDYGWPKITFQTDANGEHGNSGCPVFSMDGVVRGVLVGGCSNGIIYCVPSDIFMGRLWCVDLLYSLDAYEFVNLPLSQNREESTHSYTPVIH